jgi:hypothetical protein
MSSLQYSLCVTLWVIVATSEASLMLLLFWRKAWRDNSAFTAFVIFCVLRSSLLLYAWFALRNSTAYSLIWWGAYVPQAVLLITLVFEVVRIVFRPFEALPRGTLGNFVLATLTIASLTVAFALRFPGTQTSEWRLFLRALDQGVSWTLWGVFATLAGFSAVLGIPWNHRIYGIIIGFAFYLSVDVAVVTITVQSGYTFTNPIWPLDMLAFLVACFTWTYCFARAEVPRTVPTMIEVRRLATVLSQYVILVKTLEVERDPLWQPQGNNQLNSDLGGKHDAA